MCVCNLLKLVMSTLDMDHDTATRLHFKNPFKAHVQDSNIPAKELNVNILLLTYYYLNPRCLTFAFILAAFDKPLF